jgi:ribonuclease Z
MKITANEYGDNPVPFEDEILKITPIPILPSPLPRRRATQPTPFRSIFQSRNSAPTGTQAELLAHRKNVVDEMFQMTRHDGDSDEEFYLDSEAKKRRDDVVNQDLPETQPSLVSVAYLVKNHDVPAMFNLEKALELGVPRGKLFATLKNGKDVQVTQVVDGVETTRTIRPEDVLFDNVMPGAVVLILDIPSKEYVTGVIQHEILNSDEVKKADIVVHMLSDEVASDERYVKWMDSFKDSSQVDCWRV